MSWIREIRGKQEQLKVDRMVAVSTTGFRQDAAALARRWNIDLRTVTWGSDRSGSSASAVRGFTLVQLEYLDLWVEERAPMRLEADRETVQRLGHLRVTTTTPIVRAQGKLVSIRDVAKTLVFAKWPIPSEVDFERAGLELEMKGPIPIRALGQDFSLNKVEVPLTITQERVHAVALLSAYRDPDTDDIYGMTGITTIVTRNREFKVLVTAAKGPTTPEGETPVEVRMSCLDDQLKPYHGGIQFLDLKAEILGADGRPVPLRIERRA